MLKWQACEKEKHSFQKQAFFKSSEFCFWIIIELNLIGPGTLLECTIILA